MNDLDCDRDENADRSIAVLDVEASSLMPGSYPIEVALAYVADGTVKSWLIRPAEQ
jgi:hypothetical protein